MLLHDESASDHACLRMAGAAKAAVCRRFTDSHFVVKAPRPIR